MIDSTAIAADLHAHSELCAELLVLVERESQALREPDSASAFEFYQQRQLLLPRLNESVARVKNHRIDWQRLAPEARAQFPEIASLVQSSQDLVLKIIVMDRENEQARLRHGMLPPNQLPPANGQRPHFVSELYRRSAQS
jgi:hypothetical protein